MVVVESLAQSHEGDLFDFDGVDMLVVRLVSPEMGSRVDQPGGVEDVDESEDSADEVCVPCGLTPEGRDYSRHHEAAERHEEHVVSGKSKVCEYLISGLVAAPN